MREFTLKEYMELDNYLHKCGWIRRGAKIVWDETCFFGKYVPYSDTIHMMNRPNMLKELVPCVIHELTHRQQRRKYGIVLFSLLNLTRCFLETEAKKNEQLAEQKLKV